MSHTVTHMFVGSVKFDNNFSVFYNKDSVCTNGEAHTVGKIVAPAKTV